MYCGIGGHQELRDEFENERTQGCNPGDNGRQIEGHHRLILGRRFTSDLLVLDIPWPDEEFISINESEDNQIQRPEQARAAANSICQALIQVTTSGNCGLSISPSDINGDVRLYRDEESGVQGFHIFLYERSDGGTGLLRALYQLLHDKFESIENPGSVISDLMSVLSGQRCITDFVPYRDGKIEVRTPCNSICNGCLQDFTTQHMAGQLNRELGYHFLQRGLYGVLDNEKMNLRIDYLRLKRLVEEAVKDIKLKVEIEFDYFASSEGMSAKEDGDELPDEIKDIYLRIRGIICGDVTFTVASTLENIDEDATSFEAWKIENNPERVITHIKRHLGDSQSPADRLRSMRR